MHVHAACGSPAQLDTPSHVIYFHRPKAGGRGTAAHTHSTIAVLRLPSRERMQALLMWLRLRSLLRRGCRVDPVWHT